MTHRRAFSTLEIKGMHEEDGKGIITGIASTPSPDRVDDVVVSTGVQFKLPIPLLWQHNSGDPIGHVVEATVKEDGIEIVAEVARGVTDDIDKYWKLIKAGLVRGLSIGFRGLDAEMIDDTWGIRFNTWEWLELSAVTIPANSEASIQSVKHFYEKPPKNIAKELVEQTAKSDAPASKAASGNSGEQKQTGVPVKTQPVSLTKRERGNDMNIQEQIAAMEAKRNANAEAMSAIQEKAADRGETKTVEEKEQFKDLAQENVQIDEELTDLRMLEKQSRTTAKAVEPTQSATEASALRDPRAPARVKRHENLPKGIGFARYAKVKALAKLDGESVREKAREMYGEDSNVYGAFTKASVTAGGTASGNWAENLVSDETSVFADFVEYLRPMTVLGKFGTEGIPSLRNVPFDTPLLGQTSGGNGYWVGEGAAKPLTQFGYSRTSLQELKVATIAVVTEELLRRSSISADENVRDQLAAAVAERIDQDFIDPAKAAVVGSSPASITNGLTPVTSTGNTADAVREDVRLLMNTFIAADNAPTTGVWVMSSTTALALSLLQNPLGQGEFPAISMMGGRFQGLPTIVSEYVPSVSAGSYVALVNAQDIWFADEGGVQVDMSREASLQMDDAPTGDSMTPTGTSMVSLWQTNSVGFRAERILNWAKRRPSAVALLDSVTWGQP